MLPCFFSVLLLCKSNSIKTKGNYRYRKTFDLGKEVLSIAAKQPLINEEIHEKQVRVIGPDNEQLGIMSSQDALKKAEEADYDLVLIAPQGNPPVCRIMDYGKYRFEQAKKEKEARKNQKQSELKEINMFLNIDVNDFNRKVAQANKFLQNGDKVKIKIRFKRARELSHIHLGEDLMKRFMDATAEFGAADKPSVLEGKNFSAVIIPKASPSVKKSAPKPENNGKKKEAKQENKQENKQGNKQENKQQKENAAETEAENS